MPEHTIPAEVLLRASGHRSGRRPRLTARLAARLRAHAFDRRLAVGVPADPGSALAAHTARVTSAAERQALARALRQVRQRADAPLWSSSVPVHADNVAAAGQLIDRLITRLETPGPVGARGMARLRLVLGDGSGPLYRCGRGDLAGRLGAALAAL